jgi:hypothetical protein
MKSFIVNSIIFFALGALATVAVFYLVNRTSLTPHDMFGLRPTQETIEEVAAEAKQIQETLEKVPETGIPLSSLKLSDTQKSGLQKVGIDTKSFVITKDMIACSAQKLGAERTQALVAGEAPSLIEITTLTPCLKSSE